MSRHRITRYMSRFECLGPACEASCCSSGWGIPVDERHYVKLERLMGGSDADRERFRTGLRLITDERRGPVFHAQLVLDAAGVCPLLDPERTCSVQRRFGEDALPDTCAVYPRMVSLSRGRVEVAGSLSCPEVARLLYVEPDATELGPLDIQELRDRATTFVAVDSDDPYDLALDDVRATIVDLLETPGYPLASRLFFVGWLAEQTRAAFHRGAGDDALDRLADAIEQTDDPARLAALHRGFASLEATTPLPGRVIAAALRDRIEAVAFEPFARLVRECYASLGAPLREGAEVEWEAAYAAYLARRAARDGAAIDGLLTRYAIDYWIKELYTRSPDLAAHASKLVLRVALVRFLLFGHPRFDAADPRPALVEVTYKLARAVEHDRAFADDLDGLLAREGVTSLAHAMFLMKV